MLQDEVALLARVATKHDTSLGLQLQNSAGWATLMTILQTTGERLPKRLAPFSTGDSLAKRMRGTSLR